MVTANYMEKLTTETDRTGIFENGVNAAKMGKLAEYTGEISLFTGHINLKIIK